MTVAGRSWDGQAGGRHPASAPVAADSSAMSSSEDAFRVCACPSMRYRTEWRNLQASGPRCGDLPGHACGFANCAVRPPAGTGRSAWPLLPGQARGPCCRIASVRSHHRTGPERPGAGGRGLIAKAARQGGTCRVGGPAARSGGHPADPRAAERKARKTWAGADSGRFFGQVRPTSIDGTPSMVWRCSIR